MDNDATDGAGANANDAVLAASNSIFACNAAVTDGGGVFLEGSSSAAAFVNAILYGDTSATGTSHGSAVYGGSSTTLTMTNAIVFSDSTAYSLYGAGTGSFDYSDVYNDSSSSYTYGGSYSAGTGGISSDPDFVSVSCDGNPNNDDYALGTTSPCIDAGHPSTSYYDVDGSQNDMGAYGGPEGAW